MHVSVEALGTTLVPRVLESNLAVLSTQQVNNKDKLGVNKARENIISTPGILTDHQIKETHSTENHEAFKSK